MVLMVYVCATYPILYFAAASTALHRILICFIVVPFSDFQYWPIFYTISIHVNFNYQLCDCIIFYSIFHRYLTHIIINFLSIHLLQKLKNWKLPILVKAPTIPCYKHLAFKNKLTMCYEININVDHNGHSLRQKNFTVEWFSMLGHELIEQPSYWIF